MVSCCGDEVSTSSMSGGLRPKASSKGVLPPYVTETFLAQQASRKISLGVVVLKTGFSRISANMRRTWCLNNLTAASARFGQGVPGPRLIGLIPRVR